MKTIRIIVVAIDCLPGSDASLRQPHAFDMGAWHRLKGAFAARRFFTEPSPNRRVKPRLTELAVP